MPAQEARVNAKRFSSIEAVHAAVDAGEFGDIIHMTVLHDDACSPAGCVCTPEYLVEEGTPEAILRGAEAHQQWVKETTR